MTLPQLQVLKALGKTTRSTSDIAARIDRSPVVTGHILYALARRSLVTVTASGNWYATDRGRARAAAKPRGRAA